MLTGGKHDQVLLL